MKPLPATFAVHGTKDLWFVIAPADHEFRAGRSIKWKFAPSPACSTSTSPRRVTTMPDRIRIIKHELFRSKCGSFEVHFADGRASKFFHFDDVPSPRLRPEMLTSGQALEQAKAFARAERDKDDSET
jgi:hypothetical protein